jgi:Mlc titration factor MtfA (ptsG expression regulator)
MPSLLRRLLGPLAGPFSGESSEERARRRAAELAAAIDQRLWQQTLAQLPWLAHLDDAALTRLRELTAAFLHAKTITGAAGFEVDDRVRLAIAVQACLPILRLGLSVYDDFVEIVVYPDRFLVARSQVDDTGVVHESTDELAGEAMERGPVVLSWPDADPAAGNHGWNVVIHEFAHKIDMLDGEADGVPPLPARQRQAWADEIDGAWESFCGMLDRLEAAIPRHVDPESEQGEAWYAQLPLDPYAATDVGEFFAVAAETFFVDPGPLAEVFPDLYRLLADYFGQDPLAARRRDAR